MQDIKPDTSLYTDLPNKLRALALIMEFPDIEQREMLLGGKWNYGGTDNLAVIRSLGSPEGPRDYRIKPKPRELWVLYGANGEMLGADDKKFESVNGGSVVRFVEQPE